MVLKARVIAALNEAHAYLTQWTSLLTEPNKEDTNVGSNPPTPSVSGSMVLQYYKTCQAGRALLQLYQNHSNQASTFHHQPHRGHKEWIQMLVDTSPVSCKRLVYGVRSCHLNSPIGLWRKMLR